jgi:branched-chain amino acid transport system substrate-binding protein
VRGGPIPILRLKLDMKHSLLKLALVAYCVCNSIAFADGVTKIGVILPLTGPVAEYGVAARNGMELAIKDSPQRFQSIALTFEDSAYDNKRAVDAFHRLRDLDDVALVFNWGTEPGLALAPIAERNRFPLITVSHDPRASLGKKFVLRFINPSRDFAQRQAQYLISRGFKRIGVLTTELSYFNSFLKELRDALGSQVSVDVIQTFQPSEQDFKIAIAKAKANGYDVIGVLLLTGQIAQFYREAAQLNLKVPTFGTDVFDSTSEVRSANGSMSGAVFTNIRVDEEFRRKYEQAFGNDVQVQYAGNAYDFANLLVDALKHKEDTTSILDAIDRQHARLGVTGNFSPEGDPSVGRYFQFPVVLKEVRGSSIVEFDGEQTAAPDGRP